MGEKELLSGRKDELRSWEKKCYCPREELPPWKEGITTHTERSYYSGREGVSTLEERMSYFPERVTALREELIPRKRSYFRELLHREELLPGREGVSTLKERISYFPEKELLLWERSYYPEGVITLRERRSIGVTTLIERKSYCPESGVTTLILWKIMNYYSGREDELLTWDRSYCPEIGVTTLTQELPPWHTSYYYDKEELLTWERSYCL